MKGRTIGCLGTVALLALGCDAAEGVRVQELPSLERSTPEARAGLPEVAGEWRFAGWELQPADSAFLAATLPTFGTIHLDVQRLDSIAGSYLVAGSSFAMIGEVRRDSVVALVAQAGEGGRYLAGRVARDTLWVSATTLLEPGSWPAGARAAFVRSPVTSTFARLEGQPTILPGDTIQPVLAGELELPADEGLQPPVAAQTPAGEPPPADRPTTPAATPPAAPRATPAEQPRATPPAAAPAAPATPPAARPAQPPPAEEPPRRTPRLLGEPVQQDSIQR